MWHSTSFPLSSSVCWLALCASLGLVAFTEIYGPLECICNETVEIVIMKRSLNQVPHTFFGKMNETKGRGMRLT